MIVLAVLALFVIAAVVPDWVDTIWPVVAIALPFIQARLVSASATKWFKFVVAVAFAAAAGGATALGMDWTAGFEPSEVVERIAAIFGVAYATYKIIDLRLKATSGLDFNEHELAAPNRGIGPTS